MCEYRANLTEQTIDYRFKILYALGMIFIVAGHCGNGGISLGYEWFEPYAFHLGLFAFCSGYFYKSKVESEPIRYVLKKIKTLLMPLYLWNFAYAILVSLLETAGFTIGAGVTWQKLVILPLTSGHQFMYSMGSWFIMPLFVVEVCNVLLRWCVRNFEDGTIKELLFLVTYLAIGICGVYAASIGYNVGWYLVLVRIAYFVPFYGFGIFYRRVLEKFDKISGMIYFLVIFLIQLAIIYVYERIPSYIPSMAQDYVDGPILPFVVGFLGIAFWLRVAKILEPAIGRNKYVNLIADNTYSIMINQFLGFMLVKTIFATVSKYTSMCPDFDWVRYKTDLMYYYLPKGISQMRILYLVAGIVVPIGIQWLINRVKKVLLD